MVLPVVSGPSTIYGSSRETQIYDTTAIKKSSNHFSSPFHLRHTPTREAGVKPDAGPENCWRTDDGSRCFQPGQSDSELCHLLHSARKLCVMTVDQ